MAVTHHDSRPPAVFGRTAGSYQSSFFEVYTPPIR